MRATFAALRFFIVPIDEHLFTRPLSDRDKLKLFVSLVLRDRDFQDEGRNDYALRITERSDVFFLGKLARRGQIELHSPDEKDIMTAIIDDWPFIEFFVDVGQGQQLVYFEMNSRVARSVQHLVDILTTLSRESMFTEGYQVSFEPIVAESDFWDEVKASRGVVAVTFQLLSPNLFGGEKSANEALKDLREEFNQTKLTITLENPSGRLVLPEAQVEKFRDYADSGGGHWLLRTLRRGKRRSVRKVDSRDRAKRVSVEFPEDAGFIERIAIVKRMLFGGSDSQ